MHGSNSGYQKHMRDRTEPCEACRAAHRVHVRRWRGGKGSARSGLVKAKPRLVMVDDWTVVAKMQDSRIRMERGL